MSMFSMLGAGRGKRVCCESDAHAKYLQLTLDAMSEAIICCDAAGRLTFVNKAAMKLISCHSASVLGESWQSLFELIDESNGSVMDDPFRSCVISGVSLTNGMGCILRTSSRREVFVETNTVPVYDESDDRRAIGATMTIRDLTDISGLLASVFRQGPHDVLTPLLDESAFAERLSRALLTLQKPKEHILLQIEIAPSSRHQHQTWLGIDDVIDRQVVSLLASRIRDRDALGQRAKHRYNLLLEHCECDEGVELANQLRRVLMGHDFFIQGQSLKIEAYVGVVSLNQRYVRTDEIIRTVERACDMARSSTRGVILVVPNA